MNSIIPRKDEFIIIIWTTFLAGTLDITAAFINSYLRSEVTPDIVLQYIASGVLGREAFSGGLGTAFLGLIFHYLIAFVWTLIFFKLYPLLRIKPTYQIPAGLIYGIFHLAGNEFNNTAYFQCKTDSFSILTSCLRYKFYNVFYRSSYFSYVP